MIHIKDNADRTLSYVFDKFCIFEKGYMNGPYAPLIPLITPQGTAIPLFNYGNSNGVLFYFTDGKGDTITVQQNPETGSYTLTFPDINTNDTLVTTNLAQTLTKKTLTTPILNSASNAIQFGTGIDIINIQAAIQNGSGTVNLVLPGTETMILTNNSLSTLYNKTLYSPIFSGTTSGILQNASQYCFEAYNSVGKTDATGSGTNYLVIFDTNVYQVGTGYDNTTGVFTEPLSGKYIFVASVSAQGFVSSNNTYLLGFTHNGTAYWERQSTGISDLNGVITQSVTRIISLAVGDTVSVNLAVGGNSTNNISIVAGSSSTWFQGYLLINS